MQKLCCQIGDRRCGQGRNIPRREPMAFRRRLTRPPEHVRFGGADVAGHGEAVLVVGGVSDPV